jgi:hypothetical protein
MPAFLTQEQFAPWLSGEAGVEYQKPTPNDHLQLNVINNGSQAAKWTIESIPGAIYLKGEQDRPGNEQAYARVSRARPDGALCNL